MLKRKSYIERIIIMVLFFTTLVIFFRNKELSQKLANNVNLSYARLNRLAEAIMLADDFYGHNFPIIQLKDINNSTNFYTKTKRPTIILLYSENGCNLCLESEIIYLKKLYDVIKQRNLNIDVFLIGLQIDKINLLKLIKTKKLLFPILNDEKGELLEWMPTQVSPLLLLIDQNQKIIRAHFPIIDDKILMEKNFNALQRFIN